MATTVPTGESVDDFLAAVEHPTRKADALILNEMMTRSTGCKPVMWGPSIVGFDDYHYTYDSGRSGEFLMVGFSPRKANLSLYMMPGYGAYEEIFTRLGKHKTGAACVYINKLADVDMDVLEELILTAITKMRADYPS